ncbi:MAG: DUF58 domain-containing protein [Deltaproteobacteria bacterium]|nr:DUF58 domain-containing protein [Deltaproteobacteria bacterium]
MSEDARTILDVEPGTYDAVSHLKIQVNKAVEGFQGGAHRSLHMGPSVEFSEHNRYSPGDDIRNIDWKALARTDRYFIKAHEREAQLSCLLLLDCSGSMSYRGSRSRFSKFDFAKILLGAFSHLLMKQGDAVGVIGFAETQNVLSPPKSHPGHLPVLMERLAAEPVQEQCRTGFSGVLKSAQARLGHRGMLVLASDMWQLDAEAEVILKGLVKKGHDVSVFHVVSPDELDLPFDRMVEFVGLEREPSVRLEPALIRHNYMNAMAAERERLFAVARSARIDMLSAVTSREPFEVLAEFATRRLKGRK